MIFLLWFSDAGVDSMYFATCSLYVQLSFTNMGHEWSESVIMFTRDLCIHRWQNDQIALINERNNLKYILSM